MNNEDIKLLKSIVKVHNTFLKGCKKETITEREIQAIENLLKENEELKTMLKNRIKYTNELEQDLFENASNYVISKAIIKEKIEELEEEKECFYSDYAIEERNNKIQVLKELLEGK